MPTSAALTGPWRPTCCGCLGASCSTTATGTAWTGSSCPTHGRLQMLRMRTSLRGVGVQQCLLPRTVASVTPAPRRPRVLSSPDAPCCSSYVHMRGSQSVGPSSITRRTGLIFTATLVYDIAVEAHCPDRVMRQFGLRQPFSLPPPLDRVPQHDHR